MADKNSRKGSKENPITESDLEKLRDGLEEVNQSGVSILEANIKDGLLFYKYEITVGPNVGDKHKVDGSGIIKYSLAAAFINFNAHMAVIDEVFKHLGIDEDEKFDTLCADEHVGSYKVSGFKISGSADSESIVLIGHKYTACGPIGMSTPKIVLDTFSPYKFYEELKAASDAARWEVVLYKEGNFDVPEVDEKPAKKMKQLTLDPHVNDEKESEVSPEGKEAPESDDEFNQGKVE